MLNYKCLNQQVFEIDAYKIIPIRLEDRYEIMKWRNDQMYHLRQNKNLTPQDQDLYFENVVSKLFDEENPEQILFSFLENNSLIGYGGMVHINWQNKNAEISFLLNSQLESKCFENYFTIFLRLIENVAFVNLKFHKLYTYAYDLRPKLYEVLEAENFIKEAVLKEHIYFHHTFIDVVIHYKINLM